ncbi:Transcription factor IIIB 90 kDa subunit [Habropoda laboriosa]|uniref:Transcription factor IIIB 90 kDa subunit n=1 Tax=Habropoda laboriosa TaxID=597456 RepID=A0A0L7R9Y5_9HYME|nr:Transcription factor IIIB 90 kDa subunit [Habropoda laboriosa]
MRFANKLEFGEKTHEVSMTALRVVQRMKRDSIHSGRRPSGLCGAALLMAARLHEFNRSPADIIKVVKVHESTLRKRLIEFGDTPSSSLTLEEFMTVDLEEEQDPPAFKVARKKDRERLQRVNSGEIVIADLDDEELDSYIMSEKEAQFKHNLWNKVNAEYLIQQKEKEERRQKEKEEGKPEKKRRRTTKRNKSQAPANTAGEAIEKMLQEKKISSKINYEVLKSLNVGLSTSNKEQQKVEEPVQSLKTEVDSAANSSKIPSGTSPSKIQDKPITQTVKKPRLVKPHVQQAKKKELETSVEVEINTVEPTLAREDICDMDETDDYIDEEVEADPTEMTVGQMLERNASEDENDFGYGYDEEDY